MLKQQLQTISNKFDLELQVLSFVLILASAISISLKLSITYLFLIPLLGCTLILHSDSLRKDFKSFSPVAIFYLFCASSAVCCLQGIDALHSLTKLGSLTLCGLLMVSTREFARCYGTKPLLFALAIGQSIACFYSISSKLILGYTPEIFHGDVTHSGQLALLIPIFFTFYGQAAIFNNLALCYGIFSTLLLTLSVVVHSLVRWPTLALTLLIQRKQAWKLSLLIITATTLLVNLKRGPWLGVGIALSLIFIKTRPRILVPLLIIGTLSLTCITPLRERAFQARDHFFIAGGRSAIWKIGGELSTRYPLGIGFGNSKILRKFSEEIPYQHRHFHNNFLNLVVETGWINAGIFLAWLIVLIKLALQQRTLYTIGLACSLIAWQIAGISEYNIGDSEILLIAFMVAGLIMHAGSGLQETD